MENEKQFHNGVWRTAILVLRHSNFVSPLEIEHSPSCLWPEGGEDG